MLYLDYPRHYEAIRETRHSQLELRANYGTVNHGINLQANPDSNQLDGPMA